MTPKVSRVFRAVRSWALAAAQRVGQFQTTVLLGVTYCTVVAVTAVMARILRQDFLRLHSGSDLTYWQEKEHESTALRRFKRQF